MTKIGIQGAYFDIHAQQAGMPLSTIFGGSPRVLSIGEGVEIKRVPEEVVREVQLRIHEGYKRIKIKIKPGHDFLIIQRVRDAFPDIALGIDANGAYDFRDIEILRSLDQFDLLFIEQPFAQSDLRSHAFLQKQITAPVCLDESIVDMASCKAAIEMQACRMINIKPARIGSFSTAKAIHDYCLEYQIPLFGGGRMETGLGKLINANFYSLPGFTMPADMTPPLEYFPEDIITPPLKVHKGELHLDPVSGLGVDIDEHTLRKYSRYHKSFV